MVSRRARQIIAHMAAAILMVFGVLFIVISGAFSPAGSVGWIPAGLTPVGIGFGIIWFAGRRKPVAEGEFEIALEPNLPGEVNLNPLKCQSCGGALSADNINMVAGARAITCPYCGTAYQLKEGPKW